MRGFRASIALLCLLISTSALAEIRTYDVDDKHRQDVYRALKNVLVRTESGQVELLPAGQILIDTTPERHAEVDAVLEAVRERRAEAAPRVTLRYWAVLGSREATRDADTPEILSEVIEELERVHGELAFRVLGNATLVTESGQVGEIDGEPLSVRQQAYVQDGTLDTELEIRFRYRRQPLRQPGGEQPNPFLTAEANSQHVELTMSMARGEFVVVGENTIRGNTVNHGALDGTIFYIVHWPGAR